MRFILSVLLILIMSSVTGQDCAKRFFAGGTYVTTKKGVGFEFGAWPGKNNVVGFLAGFEIEPFTTTTMDSAKNTITQTSMISQVMVKGVFRFNRYLYGIGQLGAYDFDTLIPAIGLRSVIPFDDGRVAIWLEPQLSTKRMAFLAGVAFSVK